MYPFPVLKKSIFFFPINYWIDSILIYSIIIRFGRFGYTWVELHVCWASCGDVPSNFTFCDVNAALYWAMHTKTQSCHHSFQIRQRKRRQTTVVIQTIRGDLGAIRLTAAYVGSTVMSNRASVSAYVLWVVSYNILVWFPMY